jgi:hypothetical protein
MDKIVSRVGLDHAKALWASRITNEHRGFIAL